MPVFMVMINLFVFSLAACAYHVTISDQICEGFYNLTYRVCLKRWFIKCLKQYDICILVHMYKPASRLMKHKLHGLVII